MQQLRKLWVSTAVVCILAASLVGVCHGIVHRPPSVPIGAEWLKSMPKGGEFNPPKDQPVVEVNWKTCKSGVQVVEYLYAEVKQANLGHGTDTNAAIRQWVASIGQNGSSPREKDDAGHIIGKNQGGLGTVHWNIFPQSQHFNRGVYARDVERLVNDAVKRQGVAKMWFRLEYGDAQYPCRPIKFSYYLLTEGFAVHNDLLNPHNPAPVADLRSTAK